jgi:hypothetical protein
MGIARDFLRAVIRHLLFMTWPLFIVFIMTPVVRVRRARGIPDIAWCLDRNQDWIAG